MNRIINLLLFLLCLGMSMEAYGQVGLISDIDGYTNVREEPNSQSRIICRLNDGEAFSIDEAYIEMDSRWIKVWIPSNKFSKFEKDYSNAYITGFVHKSRIVLIDSLQTIDVDQPRLIFDIQKADTSRVSSSGEWGLEIPLADSHEVSSLSLKWKEQIIEQDLILFDDIYNVTWISGLLTSEQERFKTYQRADTFYIHQQCADGAGYYEIVWVIKEGIIIQRVIVDVL